jgi:hypothetical protein
MDGYLEELDQDSAARSPAGTMAASRGDDRPKMLEPPPVVLAAVQDVRLPVVAGLETQLDEFYRDLLRFDRLQRTADAGEGPVYRAENHDLVFFVVEVPPDDRQGCRPLGILSPHYSQIIERLTEMGTEFEIVRGLVAGTEELIVKDPTGNWLALSPLQAIR